MRTETSNPVQPKRTAFCIHCKRERFPTEIRMVRTRAGTPMRRCIHCIKHAGRPKP